jgi:hypothetical protein
VTISAIDAVVTDVVLVAELYRLLPFQVTACQVRRTGDLRVRKKSQSAKYDSRQHGYPGDVICTFIEELCHFSKSRAPCGLHKKLTSAYLRLPGNLRPEKFAK